MKDFEMFIKDCPKMDYKIFSKKYLWYAKKAILFLNIVTGKNMIYKMSDNYTVKYSQVYFDLGNGFNESDSKLIFLYQKANIFSCSFKVPKECSQIRFDYSNQLFSLISKMTINHRKTDLTRCNNCIKWKKGYLSINNDPNIIIPMGKKRSINISFELDFLNSETVINELLSNNSLTH